MKKISCEIFILLLFLVIPAMAKSSSGACVGSSPTWSAFDCSNIEISACITSASSGDTINVPSGTCTWTGTVTIPVDKTINLMGAGVSGTIIKFGDFIAISSQSPHSRISGFQFYPTTQGSNQIIDIRNQGWRVDHNYFNNTTGLGREGIDATGANTGGIQPEGVIDHNTFAECRTVVVGAGAFSTMNRTWADDSAIGTSHAVFVEDNTFNKTTGNAMDANNGAKYVFRYNTVENSNIMAHSLQGAIERGTRSWEIYGNSETNPSTYGSTMFIRGGTGMIFNNLVTGAYGGAYWIELDNVRSFDGGCWGNCYSIPALETDSGLCNGTSHWDGNTPGQNGWPCRDQIGRGKDSALFDTTTYAASTSEPAYFWANKRSPGADVLAGVSNGTNNWIQANRDYYDYAVSFNGTSGVGCGTLASRPSTCSTGVGYWATNQSCSNLTGMVGANPATPISGTLYKCTAPNTWTAYYTPYTYPHPLRGGADTTAPAAPSGLTVN